jgi:phosphoadenosine phosphosulfate reductase
MQRMNERDTTIAQPLNPQLGMSRCYSLLSFKINHSIDIIKKAEQMALKYNDFGFHVAFSGGKDSQVIYELCKMAGVKFKAFFYKTSVDPQELLSFIRENYPEVEWIKPKMTMFQLIYKKGMLPLRQCRFCCEYLKERNGLNAVVITGITRAESAKRKKRQEFESSCKIGSDKNLLNPILDWTKQDVLQFLKERNIELCTLYEKQERIGCVGCPMSPKTIRRDFRNMPNFKKAYINTVQKLMDEKGKYSEFESAEDVVNWWSSGLSRSVYLANKLQMELVF